MSIRIVTDNCCDLPQETIDRYKIGITHLLVRFKDRVYQPGELTTAEFYQMMETSPVLPSTSQPTVEEMLRVYEEALADGSEVVAIHMSSGISGTFQGGKVAQKMLANKRLHVFDSRKASVGLGLMVLEAARMAEAGNSLEDIEKRLLAMQARLECIFVVGKMECLIKGGRISKSKGLLAEALDIKPILRFDDSGYIVPYEKARGLKAAMRKILGIMEEQGKDLQNQTVGLVHAGSPELVQTMANSIREKFACKEIIIGEIGPVIGAHVGKGTFSVFFER
ncbi:MAG: DegV family protein [Syntrophomonadaceae bacterium]